MTHPAFRHLGYYASVFQKISLLRPFFASYRVLTLLRERITQSCCCLLAHVVDFSCACFCQSFHIGVLLQTVHAVLPPWCRLCQVLWPRVQVQTHLGRRKRKSTNIFSLVFVRLVKWFQRFDSSYWALSRKKSGPIASLSPNSASSPLNSMSHSDVRSYGGDSWGQLDQAFHWCHMSNSLQITFRDWWL